ncbi:MAG: hypothetical protein OJF52_002400 [Nitrospira sp.]|jgi:hypothetical protein|nr:MAG: hypothetical protein OJF52_002400 [Nitrospira sp.]
MDWYLAVWTGFSWLFSGGILYLVYRFGFNNAAERGIKIKTWRSIGLLLGFLVSLAMFGTDYPDEGLLVAYDREDLSRIVGIFAVLVAAYVFGYVDGLSWAKDQPKATATEKSASDLAA